MGVILRIAHFCLIQVYYESGTPSDGDFRQTPVIQVPHLTLSDGELAIPELPDGLRQPSSTQAHQGSWHRTRMRAKFCSVIFRGFRHGMIGRFPDYPRSK